MVDDQWGPCLQTLEGHDRSVSSLAFSPNGATLASASSENTVKVWDITTGQCLRTLQIHGERPYTVVFSLKGDKLASASLDGIVRLWDEATGRLLNTFRGKQPPNDGFTHFVRAAFCSGDQQIMLASQENFEIWDIATGHYTRQFQESEPFPKSGVAFSSDGTFFARYYKRGRIMSFDTKTGTHSKTFHPLCPNERDYERYQIALSFDGTRLVSCDRCCRLRSWDTTTCQSIWEDIDAPEFQTPFESAVAYSRDGRFVACSALKNSAVEIRDAETGKVLQELSIDTSSALAFSIDGTQLVSGSSRDPMIRVWDISRVQRYQPLEGGPSTHPGCLHSGSRNATKGKKGFFVSFSSSSQLCELTPPAVDGTATNQPRKEPKLFRNNIVSVAFPYDGKKVASLSSAGISVWDFTTDQCLKTQTLSLHLPWVPSLTIFGNDYYLAGRIGSNWICIYDAVTEQELHCFKAHAQDITSTAFSNDGITLASSSKDKIIKLWDPATGDCKVTFIVPKVVEHLRFSQSGSQLITDVGNINIESLSITGVETSTPQTPQITSSEGLMLSEAFKGAWIQKDSKPILWIPPEYRAHTYDVRGSSIAFGSDSGRVLMIEFSSDISVL